MPSSSSAPPAKNKTGSSGIVEATLKLRPSLAVFDCDGTLWSGDAGEDFFYWEIERQVISRQVVERALPRYASYKQGLVSEEQMCGEMASLHAGLPVAELDAAAERFFAEVLERRVFQEMHGLLRRLREAGCELWAVSSTNEWVIRAGARRFGIPQKNVLAASVEVEGGRATSRILRVPTDEGKAIAIREQIKRPVDACFGNTAHDLAMLELARHAFVIHPSEEMNDLVREKQWPVFYPL